MKLEKVKIISPSQAEGYEPYRVTELCGNVLESVKYPIEIVPGIYPLLIGSGRHRPRIWVASPTDEKRAEWRYVVEDNEPFHPAFVVNAKKDFVEIFAGGTNLLFAQAVSKSRVVVKNIDLRPVGLNVYGDSEELKIGSATMRKMRFINLSAAFGIH